MRSFSLAILAAFALAASARADVWGEWYVGGNACSPASVRAVETDGRIFVNFDELGIRMPLGERGDGFSARKTCALRVKLNPPEGYFLAGFRQVYRGGLIKSLGASARLNIRYSLGTELGNALPLAWDELTAINAEDPDATFDREYYNDLSAAACGEPTIYGLNLTLTAARHDTDEFFVGGLDAMDSRLELIPLWEPCE